MSRRSQARVGRDDADEKDRHRHNRSGSARLSGWWAGVGRVVGAWWAGAFVSFGSGLPADREIAVRVGADQRGEM